MTPYIAGHNLLYRSLDLFPSAMRTPPLEYKQLLQYKLFFASIKFF
jgi:hypothetical protein